MVTKSHGAPSSAHSRYPAPTNPNPPRPDVSQKERERFLTEIGAFSAAGVERAAWGWDQHGDRNVDSFREARAVWNGDLLSGTGSVSAVSSGKFNDLPVSWSARTEAPGGKSSPEELLAAAHASCFAMALSAGLGRAGTKPNRLEVRSKVTFDKIGDSWTVVSSELEVKGDVPGADTANFVKAAEDAKENCPVSRALKGNVKLSARATLS